MPTQVTDPDILAQLNAPARAPVPSSARVVGDQEAEQRGLYETPRSAAGPRPVTDPNILRQLNGSAPARTRITVGVPFGERLPNDGGMQAPAEEQNALLAALKQRGIDLTRGPSLPPGSQMAQEADNVISAAEQGTTPNIGQHGGNLISNQLEQNDAGEILYRDPQTKQLVPTDSKTQVVLRDPVDGELKVFSRTEDTNENPAVGVARVLAPGLAAGAVTARSAVNAAPKIVPKASDIFSTAKPYYRAFTNEAGKIEIPKETATGIADRLRQSLDKANLIPELALPIYSAIATIEKGERMGGPLTLDRLQSIKRVIGRGFKSPDANIRDAAAVATREIGNIISEVSPEAGQNLKMADAIQSTAYAKRELQQKEAIAGLRTGRAGYGGNAVNNMRQVLSPIVEASIKRRVTGFKPDEIAAMRDIVEGTGAVNALRVVSKAAPTKSFHPVLETLATAGVAPTIGSVANKLASILTGKQIERLNELVAKRSPAYRAAVQKATDRYLKAQTEFAQEPTPNRLAAYVSASRALSSGFNRDGIQITSGQLLKQIAGEQPASAEEK